MKTGLTVLLLCGLACAAPVTLRVMLIGWPLYDFPHPISKQPIKSVYSLFSAFEAQNPDIKIDLIPAQWGSGSSGFLPKSRALLLSDAVDVIEAPLVNDFANQGVIENLEPWIAKDLDTSDYLPGALDRYAALIWKDGKYHRYALPVYNGVRMTGYDRKIFRDFGVDTLSPAPTPQEVLEKAAKMTGIDPVTGKQVYGLYFRGRYKVFLFPNLLDAFGGGWGRINMDGTFSFTWTRPENKEALIWLLKASRYCPPSLLGAGEELEAAWGTADNNFAIWVHAFGDYLFTQNYMPGIREKDNSQRFRFVQLFRDPQGGGGFPWGSPVAMAAASPHKKEAWQFIKWLSGNLEAQQYVATSLLSYPVTRAPYSLPLFQGNENFKSALAELSTPVRPFPYAGTPIRYAMENEIDKALLAARECSWDTLKLRGLAKECLVALKATSDAWTASENKIPPAGFRPFSLSRFAIPFFSALFLFILVILIIGRRALRRSSSWYLFLLPSLLIMVLFLAYPIAESFRLGLFRSDGFMEAFARLDNYKAVARDPNFLNALYNTAYIALFHLAIGIPLGFVLASLINSQKKARTAFKILYFMPMVTSVIASAVLFKFLFTPDIGLVNHFLQKLGLPAGSLLWLASPATAKAVVIIFALWHGTGYTIIICLSGLQSVPDQLYEAASIDGCGGFQKWRHITLPNMRPTFVFLLMTGCIGALKRFEDVFTFGGMLGSPARSMQTVVAYIFEQAFGAFNFGAASAAAYLLFALILLITLVNYRAMLQREA